MMRICPSVRYGGPLFGIRLPVIPGAPVIFWNS
jgi:hypothetical protein